MSETCPSCGMELAPVTTDGWIDKALIHLKTSTRVRFYGVFSKFDGLAGEFGWIERPEEIPPGLFCPHGHIGISKTGRNVRP